MESREPLTVFTTDPRYRIREKLALLLFLGAIGVGVVYREPLKFHFDRWRLHVGFNEWDALYDLSARGAEAVPYLEGYLDHPDPDIRFRTLLCLKSMHEPAAVRAIATRLHDPDMIVRVNAIDAMAEMRHTEAVPGIIEGLSAEEPSVRRVSHRSLEQISGERFEYDEYAGREEQERVIARWQAWWDEERRS